MRRRTRSLETRLEMKPRLEATASASAGHGQPPQRPRGLQQSRKRGWGWKSGGINLSSGAPPAARAVPAWPRPLSHGASPARALRAGRAIGRGRLELGRVGALRNRGWMRRLPLWNPAHPYGPTAGLGHRRLGHPVPKYKQTRLPASQTRRTSRQTEEPSP